MFARVIAVHGVCHLLNGITAFLVVWLLPRDQYAWFTLAAAMMAILQVLTDGGVSSAVLSAGGGVWQNRARLSVLVQAAFQLNRFLTGVVVVCVAPVLAWMLIRQGADWGQMLAITALCVLPQWAANRAQLVLVVLKLSSRVSEVQIAELAISTARLVLTLALWLSGLAEAAWVIAAVSVSIGLQSWVVRSRSAGLLDQVVDPGAVSASRSQILQTVRHLYPSAIFTCVQGHLAVWMLSFMGRSGDLADIGALGRLGFLVNIAGAPLVTLAAPAFARCQNPGGLRRIFFLSATASAAFMFPAVLLAGFRPDWVLGLFGSGYKHLGHELWIVMSGLSLTVLGNVCSHLNLARGWTRHFWMAVPLSILAQLMAVLWVDLSTLAGMAWLGFALAAANLFFHGLLMLISLFQMPGSAESVP